MARTPSRLRRRIPLTLERKRVWDSLPLAEGDGFDTSYGLGLSIDVERLRRQRLEDERIESPDKHESEDRDRADNDLDSMLDSTSEISEQEVVEAGPKRRRSKAATVRASTPHVLPPIQSSILYTKLSVQGLFHSSTATPHKCQKF